MEKVDMDFCKRFIEAQADFETLPKDKQGYGYKYTDWDTVISKVRPILKKHELGFTQLLDTKDGKNGITTRVFSSSGGFIESWVTIPDITIAKANAAQNFGASITYMKRYALCAMLGISSDEDIDAETRPAEQYTRQSIQQPPKVTQPPKVQQSTVAQSPNVQQPPKSDVAISEDEMNKLINAVEDYIEKGLIEQKDLGRAENYIKIKNASGLQAVISYCKKKEQSIPLY